jgi:hypothetical protein
MLVVAPDPDPEPAAAEEPDAIGEEEDAAGVDEPEAAVEDPLELQAATPKAQLRASPDTAMSLFFTIFSLRDVCSFSAEVRLGAAPWMRAVT